MSDVATRRRFFGSAAAFAAISAPAVAAANGVIPASAFVVPTLQATYTGIGAIIVPVTGFRTIGYATAGDGGDAIYVKGSSSGPMAIQDASGQYWVLANVGVVNAKACGATGTGLIDDTPGLNNANTIATGFGCPIQLPTGTYLTTGWYSVGVPVYSDGTATIKGLASASSHIVTVNGPSNWYLRNITIDAQQFGQHALSISNCTNAKVQNCSILNASFCGIYGLNLIDIEISHNYIANCGFTAAAAAVGSGSGMSISGTSGLIFSNRINATGGAGISGGSYVTGNEMGDLEISSNRIYNSGTNIQEDNITFYGYGNQLIRVTQNVCINSANNGIHIGGPGAKTIGNEIYNSVQSGILCSNRVPNTSILETLGYATISGNTIVNAQGAAAIECDLNFKGTVSGNECVGPVGIGILLNGVSRQMSITGNTIDFPASHGISFGGLIGSSIVGNTITLPATGSIKTLGAITAGSGYTPPQAGVTSPYVNVPLTGGTGSGATADIWISPAGVVTLVTLNDPGKSYAASDTLSALAANIGGTGSGFSIPVSAVWTVSGQCINNYSPGSPFPSSANVNISGNTLINGVAAVNNADSSATLAIGFNLVGGQQSGTNPYLLHTNDVVYGVAGFGGNSSNFAFGQNVLATGANSMALGSSSNSLVRQGFIAHASGNFATFGDAQRGFATLHGKVLSGSTCRLTSDGNSAAAHNIVNIATLTAISVTGRIIVADTSGNAASFGIEYLMTNNAGTVTMIGTPTVTTLLSNGTSASWSVSVTADSTNLGVNITVTAVINAQAVAELNTRETIW